MTEIIFAINEAQFHKLLAAQQGWWPVVSVFVSAFLAMMVGIGVERLRVWFDRRKIAREREEHEVQQINVIISGLAFNIELLYHNASQNILPHYRDTEAVFREICKDSFNDKHIANVIASLPNYPCLFMTCPEMYLIGYDFSQELPFIIERDPEIVKHSGWLINGIRELKNITERRNRYIEDAMSLDRAHEGPQNLEQFKTVVKRQMTIASTECVVSSQLFDVLIRLLRTSEEINQRYKIPVKKIKTILPGTLSVTIKELKEISEMVPIRS